MRPVQGSILTVVLIIVVALYLLAGMMFMVNRQYFSDIHMAKKSGNNRRELLDVGRLFMTHDQSSDLYTESGILSWHDCNLLNHPEYQMHDQKILYQLARLAQDCHQHSSYRLWLSGLDNIEDRLVMDQITLIENWQDNIIEDDQEVDVISKDNAWWLMLDHGALKKETLLIESEFLPVLAHKSMRIHHDHYELVLVFEDSINQQLLLYHLWIPVETFHFEMDRVFQFHISYHSSYEHIDILTMNMNDTENQNWQMVLDQKVLDSIFIRNNVLFASLKKINQREQSGLIAMYLSGMPFLNEHLVGVEHKSSSELIELIPCLYRQPLIVAKQWQIGCDVQQKIRYYFSE